MSEHEQRGHHRDHQTHQEAAGGPTTSRGGLHRQWWFWLGIGLALIGMLIYVLSNDEALQPDGQVDPQQPAMPAAG